MFKQKRYPSRTEPFSTIDIKPCSHTYNNYVENDDTPIKLLTTDHHLNLNNISIPNTKVKQMINTKQDDLSEENKKLKEKINELNILLGIERETNIQLLKHNNKLMEETQQMKDSCKIMEKKINQMEMMKTISYQDNSFRSRQEQKFGGIRNRIKLLFANNPQVGMTLPVPTLSRQPLTQRNSYNYSTDLQNKRSLSISTLKHGKRSMDFKDRISEDKLLSTKGGITLIQKRPKTKIIVSRKSLYNHY